MNAETKKIVLVGAAGIAGVAVLAALLRKGSAPASQVLQPTPIREQGAPNIPQYPVSQIQSAPINVVDAPQFMTFNFPDTGGLQQQQPADDGCKCQGDCSKLGVGPVISDKDIASGFRMAAPFITFRMRG